MTAQEITKHRIDQRDGEWCVVSEDGGQDFGCYPTEEEALNRLRQVEAAKNQQDDVEVYEDLYNVDIFRVGEWNGRKWSRQDLADMVSAFEKVGYRVPIKLGHRADDGERAYGWVKSLRLVGDKLVADFTDIPKKIFDVIKDRGFDAVSSEIFMNLKRNGVMFRRALKAVALLGSDIPAVSGLRNLRESLSFEAEDVACFTLTKEEIMSEPKDKDGNEAAHAEDTAKLSADLEAAKAEVAQLKAKIKDESTATMQVAELKEQVEALTKQNQDAEERRRQERIDHAVEDFPLPVLRKHMRALLDMATKSSDTVVFKIDDAEKDVDPEVVVYDLMKRLDKLSRQNILTEFASHGDFKRDDVPADEDPGIELDRRAKAYQAEHGEQDYSKAFKAVLNDPDNSDLKRRYAARS